MEHSALQKVLVLNGMLHDAAYRLFEQAGLESLVVPAKPEIMIDPARLGEFDALVPRMPGIASRALMERMPRLRVISSVGVGVENIDIPAATALGIAVVNQPGVGKEPVAEHAVALMLALARRIVATEREFRARGWKVQDDYLANVSDTYATAMLGKTVGIVGLGHVGSRIADICRLAFNMRVLAYSPSVPPAHFAAVSASACPDAVSLCREADYVVVATSGKGGAAVIGVREIAAMRRTAHLINISRGTVVDQAALTAALRDHRIAGAGLDVFDPEPMVADDPLLSLDNVVLTPHVANASRAAIEALSKSSVDQVRQVLDGIRPPHLLNPAVWEYRRAARGAFFPR